jgi:hypothetical protein
MKKYNSSIIIIIGFVILAILLPESIDAQCPMCKMSAESNMKGGGTAGRGLNAGILYMLVMPYLIVGGIAFWWWRNRKTSYDDTTDIAEMGERTMQERQN